MAGPFNASRAWRASAGLAVLLALANLGRLAGMAWSSDAFALIHGPIGANVFDGLQVAVVLALGHWASRA